MRGTAGHAERFRLVPVLAFLLLLLGPTGVAAPQEPADPLRERLERGIEMLVEGAPAADVEAELRAVADAAYAAGRDQLELDALQRLAQLHYERTQLFPLRDVLVAILEIYRRHGIREGIAVTERDLGNVFAMMGRPQDAIPHLDRARSLFASLEDPGGVAGCLVGLSWANADLGELALAWRRARRARDLYTAADLPTGVVDARGMIANLYVQVGDPTAAIALYERILEDGDALTDRHRLEVRGDLAIAHYQAGEYDAARAVFSELLLFYMEREDSAGVSTALFHLGEVALEAGRPDEALLCLTAAAGRAGTRQDLAGYALKGSGDALLLGGEATAARDRYRKALGIAHDLRQADLEFQAREGLARVALEQGRVGEVMEQVRRAAVLLREMSLRLGDEERIGIREERSEVFAVGREAAIRDGRLDRIARFFELGRAPSLQVGIAGRTILRAKGLPAEVVEAEARARERLGRARLELSAARMDGRLPLLHSVRDRFDRALREHEEAWSALQAKLRAAGPAEYTETTSLPEIRLSLRPGEAYVACATASGELWALVVPDRREEPRLVFLGDAGSIAEACSDLLRKLADGDDDADAALGKFAKRLLDPLDLPEELEHLYVCVEGPLLSLPFPALLSRVRPDADVAAVPSAGTLRLLGEDRALVGEGVLALGDPIYEEPEVEGDPFRRGRTLDRLPATRREVEHSASGEGDIRLLAGDATRSRLFAEIEAAAEKGRRFRTVHLACHGLIDPDEPLLCVLAVTPDGPEDDGYIGMTEILRTPIPADLVVLSACESGRGPVATGEGLLGLPRSFLLAGAPRVVASLWKVEDEATAAFMRRFYEEMEEGVPPARALVRTQAWMRSTEEWSDPKDWAAWVFWGLAD